LEKGLIGTSPHGSRAAVRARVRRTRPGPTAGQTEGNLCTFGTVPAEFKVAIRTAEQGPLPPATQTRYAFPLVVRVVLDLASHDSFPFPVDRVIQPTKCGCRRVYPHRRTPHRGSSHPRRP
jgi:hypothetical protein